MSTLRISDIPSSTTKAHISKSLSIHPDRISLAQGQATVTFKSISVAEKFLFQHSKYPRCLGKRPRVDADFMGLTVLSSSGASDEVDIVAVHGLNGHAFRTWCAGDRMWLRDFLPLHLPRARIMTYGYNSNVYDTAVVTTIPEFAQGLLAALLHKRKDKERKRPLIFICHSLGGIVVKLALNKARLGKRPLSVRGIVFLATPHRGSETASSALIRIATRTLGFRENLLAVLSLDSKVLSRIDQEFRKHYGEVVLVATFYETRKTRVSAVLPGLDRVIVGKSSAKLKLGNSASYTTHFPLERDHSGVCKFASRHEEEYKAVLAQVVKMVRRARVVDAAKMVCKALELPLARTVRRFA